MPGFYIGLMSGTSLDGIDAILADLDTGRPRLVGHHHQAYTPELRGELLGLNQSGDNELERAALAANEVARAYAAATRALLEKCPGAKPLKAIGCHGQTVRHRPAAGYTVQLVNGALLTELAGIDVVCDFRSRDIAAGGQGAPLVPAFHRAIFASHSVHRAIVNIGGIANVTDLPVTGVVTGFDCGPGNLLLDAWAQRHLNLPLDRDGAWAGSGRAIPALLTKLRADEYFRAAPPKSTGREKFNLDWLTRQLAGGELAADVQATLLALTAGEIADSIGKFIAGVQEVYLCGGGARNAALVALLAQLLAPRAVAATDALGVDAEHVEAFAFAWLAHQTLSSQPGNLPGVTGAHGARILGAIYRA
jgi:anhydro-N-acetylmuramic acid kinase